MIKDFLEGFFNSVISARPLLDTLAIIAMYLTMLRFAQHWNRVNNPPVFYIFKNRDEGGSDERS